MNDTTTNRYLAPEWLLNPSARVAVDVIGAGGTGGEVIDQLCRLDATLIALNHPGLDVRVYDGDTVSAFNVGRQRFSPAEVGSYKSVALINRINLFYGLNWVGIPRHFDLDQDRSQRLTITATDSAAFRRAFAHAPASMNNDLWLDFGNGSRRGQAVLGHRSLARSKYWVYGERETIRLPNVMDLFSDMEDDANDGPSCSMAEALRAQPFGINASLVTQAFACLVWPLFRHGSITNHGLLMDIASASTSPLPIDPQSWAMMGYTSTDLELV